MTDANGTPFGFGAIPLNAGINKLFLTLPDEIDYGTFNTPDIQQVIANQTFALFRLSTAAVVGPTGISRDGEVEDYQVQIFYLQPDFGDSPEPYPTLLEDDGALHLVVVEDFHLGTLVDIESDGIPDNESLGDDKDDGLEFPTNNDPNDEDGITFDTALQIGQPATITVTVALPPGGFVEAFLDASIDFNDDGDWDDPNEQILTSVSVVGGDNVLQFGVPATASVGNTFARFRLSRDGGLGPKGAAVSGAVEDYHVVIQEPVVLPQVSIEAVADIAGENANNGRFTVTRIGSTANPLTAQLAAVGIDLTGDDFGVELV